MSYDIYIKSFTAAQKARAYLQKHGVRCAVNRGTSRSMGCGFRLTVTDNHSRSEVCALLGQVGVSCDIS